MSWLKFLAPFILTNQEIPLEYNLMTCLPKAFAVFSPFSVISRCLYSAYVLLIISSLALSTFSYVHLCPNKCALPLSMTLFKHSRFLCCLMPSFGVSAISSKKPSSFNKFSTLAIDFITGRNIHQMKNNIRYNGNTNNTSVIVFLIGSQLNKNSQRWYFALENLQRGFCCCCFCSSFCCCCSSFHFQAALPYHRHSTLASQSREGLHQI